MDYVAVEKLKWRSRRSMLELDLYFERFIGGGGFAKLGEAELLAYQHLITLDDADLLLLFQGKEELADPQLQDLVNKIAQQNFYKEV
jgi:succinate dehydrogenase flavin-adding protein (antitoxin of CptAB toxin-antitoxin module)